MRKLLLLPVMLGLCLRSLPQGVSPPPEFSSLEPFIRGHALYVARGISVYRMHVRSIPVHIHHDPFVIVWVDRGIVIEQRAEEPATVRQVIPGQIDVYPAKTIHSLRGEKGSLRFTLIALPRDIETGDTTAADLAHKCQNLREFTGGFACLVQLGPEEQIALPEGGLNSVVVAVDSGKLRRTWSNGFSTEWHYQKGRFFPSSKSDLRNEGKTPVRLVLLIMRTAR